MKFILYRSQPIRAIAAAGMPVHVYRCVPVEADETSLRRRIANADAGWRHHQGPTAFTNMRHDGFTPDSDLIFWTDHPCAIVGVPLYVGGMLRDGGIYDASHLDHPLYSPFPHIKVRQ